MKKITMKEMKIADKKQDRLVDINNLSRIRKKIQDLVKDIKTIRNRTKETDIKQDTGRAEELLLQVTGKLWYK